jgi:hypothetical protein
VKEKVRKTEVKQYQEVLLKRGGRAKNNKVALAADRQNRIVREIQLKNY